MPYQLIYKNLTDDETTLFYLLCAKAFETKKANNDIGLKELIRNGINIQETRFKNRIIKMMNHILEIKGFEERGSEGVFYYTFFSSYRYLDGNLTYLISPDAFRNNDSIYMDLSIERLTAINRLNGKYTQRIAILLNQYRLGGYYSISLSELYAAIELPETYPPKELSRAILKPAVRKINEAKLFDALNCRFSYRNGKAGDAVFHWNVTDDDIKKYIKTFKNEETESFT